MQRKLFHQPIVTDRLLLRPLVEQDAAFIEAHCGELWQSDPAWRGALSTVPAVVAFRAAEFERHGLGALAVVQRSTGDIIGFCGFNLFMVRTTAGAWPEVELFYALAPRFRGQGLMTEAALAVVEWGFSEHRLRRIVGVVHQSNTPSIAILRRVGMVFEPWPDDPDWWFCYRDNPACDWWEPVTG